MDFILLLVVAMNTQGSLENSLFIVFNNNLLIYVLILDSHAQSKRNVSLENVCNVYSTNYKAKKTRC